MKVINIHEAKTHFSKLIEKVACGREIVIGKAGTPIAKLVPFVPEAPKDRVGGQLAGQIFISEDCWEPDEELNTALADGPLFPAPNTKESNK